jgi:hypothetical protein
MTQKPLVIGGAIAGCLGLALVVNAVTRPTQTSQTVNIDGQSAREVIKETLAPDFQAAQEYAGEQMAIASTRKTEAYLREVATRTNTALNSMRCLRAKTIYQEAIAAEANTGTPIKQTLLSKLDIISKNAQLEATRFSTYSGSAENFGTARNSIIDAGVLVDLIVAIEAGRQPKACSLEPGYLWPYVDQFVTQARMSHGISQTQNLSGSAQ